RGIVDETQAGAEKDLRRHEPEKISRQQNGNESDDQREVREQEPAEAVMPARPKPEDTERAHSGETPRGAGEAGDGGGKSKPAGQGRDDGDETIDGDVG